MAQELDALRVRCADLEAHLQTLQGSGTPHPDGGRQAATPSDEAARRAHHELTAQLDALLRSSNEVRYVINADWSELTQLSGGGFIADTSAANTGWLDDYIPAEHRHLVRAEIGRSIEAKDTYTIGHMVNRVDGTVGWALSRAVPLFDEKGEITSWLGAASDISDRKRFEEHQSVLNAELAHRIKNILSMTMAVVSQSIRHAETLEDAAETISKRITALSNAQNVLTNARFKEANVATLIREVLSPHLGDVDRIRVSGPTMVVPAQAALGLALAIHELATNAVKYGSLSNEAGTVSLKWSHSTDGSFHMEWGESGGPAVTPPGRAGFGSRLMGRIVPGYFSGTGASSYEPSGFRYVLSGTVATLQEDETNARSDR